jgi:hypothetical protein
LRLAIADGPPDFPFGLKAEATSPFRLVGINQRRSYTRRRRPLFDRPGSEGETLQAVAVDVLTETEILRPREEVAAFAADPSNATAWYRNIKAVEWQTLPPAVVGSKIRFRAQFLGRTLDYMYEVREVERGRRFVMATAQGPFPMETTYTWEDTANGTKMSLRNRGEPSGFTAVTAPVLTLVMRRANQADLRRLKAIWTSPAFVDT